MENLAAARLSEKFRPVQTASFGDDSGVLAMFDDEFVPNEFKSEQEGRVIYEHYFCIELQWPGDNTKSYKCRFSRAEGERGNKWTQRFPRQWEAFRNSQEQVPDGTPIELWPPLDKKRVFELKAAKIFTVEQIAALTDSTGPTIGMEWRKIRDQAQAFLNPAASAVQVSKLARENEDLRHKMEAMQHQLTSLSNVTPLLHEKKKRGPKPKIKSTEAA